MKFDIQHYDSVGSTMDIVRDAAIKGTPQGFTVHAAEQLTGRGRHGNTWLSPKGNLYLSVLFLPEKELKDFGQMAFIVALALKQTLLEAGIDKNEIKLKWPNDILVRGRKISGLLLEAGQSKQNKNYLILGAGVNVFSSPVDRICMKDCIDGFADEMSQDQYIIDLRDKFLEQLRLMYIRWHQDIFKDLVDEWLEYAAFINEKIKVRSSNEIREGIFRGINENGALLLENEHNKIQTIHSGEVFF